jgi:uncharacterized membrane protein YvlD (DUF360 family)
MKKGLYVFINVLVYWALVTGLNVMNVGSFGTVLALLLGGIIFALLALAVEPVLGFFKFPSNFWGLLVVGFILNLVFFVIISSGALASLATMHTGVLGTELSPLPFPHITLGTSVLVAIAVALIATLLQILVRRLGNK